MPDKPPHSPTPWLARQDPCELSRIGLYCRFEYEPSEWGEEWVCREAKLEDAAYIRHCVNMHERLVKELLSLRNRLAQMGFDSLMFRGSGTRLVIRELEAANAVLAEEEAFQKGE